MKVVLLSVGKTRSKECAALENEYAKRIRGRFDFERIYVKNDKELVERARKAQSVVLFDEHGKQFDTHAFASYIDAMLQRSSVLTCIMGDAAGIPDELKESIIERVSLSGLTFPHEIARVLFCEQLYRAQTVLTGHPYHK